MRPATYRYALEAGILATWFTERGYDLQGIIHVGANDGREIEQYINMGIEHIIAIEPLPQRYKTLDEKYGKTIDWVLNLALGNKDTEEVFYVTKEDDEKSSLLRVKENQPFTIEETKVLVRKFSTVMEDLPIDLPLYDCLILDPQGTELDVLKGFGEHLKNFKYLMVEVTDKELLPLIGYYGVVDSDQVIEYLDTQGFIPISPKCGHCDIAFLRKDLQ